MVGNILRGERHPRSHEENIHVLQRCRIHFAPLRPAVVVAIRAIARAVRAQLLDEVHGLLAGHGVERGLDGP
eukprot:9722442-Heterocapsa_arctica.AAC.1